MRNDFESNYLAHHGILGMKWGVKNGPPYPLGASDHSKSEKKAGYKKSLGGGRNEQLYNRKSSEENYVQKRKFQLTDKQKTALKIGAAVAATALVAYGAYKLGSSDKLGDFGLKGASVVDKILKRNKGAGDFLNDINDLSIASGFGLNSKALSIKEACAKVNPGYKTGALEFKNNCFSAVTADLMNRANNGKGLDVVARAATKEELARGGMSFSDILKPYSDASIDDLIIKRDNVGNAKEDLAKQILSRCNNEDGFGIIRVKSASNSAQGHYIKWEVLDGECVFSDSLSGTIERADAYLSAIAGGRISRQLEFSRVDGLAVNPFELQKLLG